jgi:hypothetical protein
MVHNVIYLLHSELESKPSDDRDSTDPNEPLFLLRQSSKTRFDGMNRGMVLSVVQRVAHHLRAAGAFEYLLACRSDVIEKRIHIGHYEIISRSKLLKDETVKDTDVGPYLNANCQALRRGCQGRRRTGFRRELEFEYRQWRGYESP